MSSSKSTLRIAMWSGPRNISTALMRSWEARGDTAVCDEPLYAHYLSVSGVEHPGRDAIIAAYESDWRKVVGELVEADAGGLPVYYQKHMAHHLLPDMMGPWLGHLAHGFLIRDPAEMLISLARVMDEPTLGDTGLPQQLALYRYVTCDLEQNAPVVDARDLLEDPASILEQLCVAFGVAYTDRMLSWEPGLRRTDGIWARYWYDNVRTSTGFRPHVETRVELPEHLRDLHAACTPYYEDLSRHRIKPQR